MRLAGAGFAGVRAHRERLLAGHHLEEEVFAGGEVIKQGGRRVGVAAGLPADLFGGKIADRPFYYLVRLLDLLPQKRDGIHGEPP